MSTTITSTQLDFFDIKTSLKTYLESTGEFNDYNFEGSGLSSLLDVLAYNTHYNGLIANFALNESYLSTAQLRNSVVSLAESIGYIPDSKTSSQATVSLTVNLAGVANIQEFYVLNPGELILRGVKDGIDYTFTNRESLTAFNNKGIYSFAPTADADRPIIVFEGDEFDQQFLVGSGRDVVYVVPDREIDIETAIIRVFNNQASASVGGGAFNVYTNLLKATKIDQLSRLYVLRESPNGFFELTFGNGTSLGTAPVAGEVINVNYLRTSGEEGNGIQTLKIVSGLTLEGIEVDPSDITLAVLTPSAGGGDKETLESIRKNAPFQYASQNRMVTPLDYSSLILKNYSTFITDITSWGGEDDPKPDYGSVFTSIVFKDDLSSQTRKNVRDGIRELADEFSVVSFDLKFTDPVETYISTQTFFQYNPSLTGLSESTIRSSVENAISQYFDENTGKFDQVFRRSNMLTRVDDVDPSVLSSRANVIMHSRIIPVLTVSDNYTIAFPVAIRNPAVSNTPSVYSQQFTFKNQTVSIRNKLNAKKLVSAPGENPVVFDRQASTRLELVTGDKVLIDDIGFYEPEIGVVNLNGLVVQSLFGSSRELKIFAIPSNESVVDVERNQILRWDPQESNTQAVIVDTR